MLSANIVKKLSSSSVLPMSIPKFIIGEYSENTEELASRVLECQNVRISPNPMLFENAFDGKTYNQKVTIQNMGKKAAFIRICPASSYAFYIKPLVRGQKLCPGLSIMRNISYTYMRATAVPLATIPIYINGVHVDYKLIVVLSGASISAIPQQIDFGTIDARQSSEVRMLSLHNDGSKGSRFAIDLGRNEIELFVEPSKGIIQSNQQPHGTVTFRIECLGSVEGAFMREFWIKCETPLRIKVTGNIIAPQLHAYHPNTTEDFTLIEFPRTYYGTSCTKTIVLKNRSSKPAIYCTLAEIPGEIMSIKQVSDYKQDYLNFHVTPLEGCFQPHEAQIFHFTYTPIRAESKGKHGRCDNSAFCCFQIVRVPCTDLTDVKMVPDAEEYQELQLLRPFTHEDSLSESSLTFSIDEELSIAESLIEPYIHNREAVYLKKNVRVILFGEAEDVNVSTRPDELNLLQMPINKTITRELLLSNKSHHIPIIFNYKKVCFVTVEPPKGTLPPFGNIELCVKITPAKIGKVITKVGFDLIFSNQPKEDDGDVVIGSVEVPLVFEGVALPPAERIKFTMGITPLYLNEVGINTDDVRFNSPLEMPRATLVPEIKKKLPPDDDDLIAFPNDRPKCVRPWKSPVRCRTICAGIPRVVNKRRDSVYQLTRSQSALKHSEDSYWIKYTREVGQRLRRLGKPSTFSLSDYDICDKKLLLLKDAPKPECLALKGETLNKPAWFIPLTPVQLNNIRVYPKYIKLKKMAPGTVATTHVTIHNQNDFPILISCKTRKPVIKCPKGSQTKVNPLAKSKITLTYHAPTIIGHYNVVVDFLANHCVTYPVSVTVDVVSKSVKLFCDEIIFQINAHPGKYLNIYNPVNVPVSYHWYVPDSCYTIEPVGATVPPYRHITCFMNFTPRQHVTSSTEIGVYSENGRRQMVCVSATMSPTMVKLRSSKIEFKDVPLNLPLRGTTVLQNLGDASVMFVILNPKPMMGVTITPTEGIIHGLGDQIFDIQIKISACISFSCIIEIEVQQTTIVKLEITGSVVYPNIVIKPESIHLQKIVTNAFERQVFVVMNKSKATATVHFLLQDYSEYTVLETPKFNNSSIPIKSVALEPNEQKELYLHFHPMGAASYCFYLPMVINGMLGPAYLHQQESLKPQFYTERNESNYAHSATQLNCIPMPKKLTTLTVNSAVGGDTVRFSKLRLNLKYFPHPDFNSETKVELKVWNGSKDTHKFCIRTDNLTTPFFLNYLTGNEIIKLDNAIVCVLAPEEEVIFEVEFVPSRPGNYNVQLPIYVRHYLQGSVFNYLTLNGWYPEPTISALEDDIYFEPVPLTCGTEYSMLLRAGFHPKACNITARTQISDLHVQINETMVKTGQPFVRDVNVLFTYSTATAGILNTTVSFSCKCGALYLMNIKAGTDNCTATTHAFVHSYTKTLLNSNPSLGSLRSSHQDLSEKACPAPSEYIDTVTVSTIFSTGNVFESLTNANETSFPLFPDDHDETEYAKHMRITITAMEMWLCYQGFYGKNYYKIPEEIALPPERVVIPTEVKGKGKPDKKKEKQATALTPLKFVELLTNLIGPQVNEYIHTRELPEDNLERINYLYNSYNMAKELIVNQGGVLPHVFPENLLVYDDYVSFLKNIYPHRPDFAGAIPPEPLERSKFYLLSKQSWMDILLQTYKVFVLVRVQYPIDFWDRSNRSESLQKQRNSPTSPANSSITTAPSMLYSNLSLVRREASSKMVAGSNTLENWNSPHHSKNIGSQESGLSFTVAEDKAFWTFISKKNPHNGNIFNDSENILLYWLEYHFNNQREELWNENTLHHSETTPVTRNIKFFDLDLSDGLVLIAVTSAYCPYLRHYICDVYTNPTCIEQAFHNASKLLQAWKMINLSFHLTPKHITNPNPVLMLTLVNYLYEVLPNFYPHKKIHFKANLSTVAITDICIENLSNSIIVYKILFFGNEKGLFSISENPVSLSPHTSINLRVNFNGKKICREYVTMLVNGESPGQPYAKSISVSLIGESIPSYCTTTITIPSPLYQTLDLDLVVQSPYPVQASYDINFSLVEPDTSKFNKIIPWGLAKRNKIPKRVITTNTHLDVDEHGVGIFNISVGCVTTNEKSVWVIFTHVEVGDFTIKITSVPQIKNVEYKTITVLLPTNFSKIRCHCKAEDNLTVNKRCPRTISINVPCRNNLLWDAVAELMMKTVNVEDLPFWTKYLGTSAGVRLNKWMAGQEAKNEGYYDIQEIFDNTVTYMITSEAHSYELSLPLITTIENVHSKKTHEIPVHISGTARRPFDFRFKMESQSGLELRHYSVRFLTGNQFAGECVITDFQ